jgi:outer membrane protein OmpA-like peptidoglycan-associated protein
MEGVLMHQIVSVAVAVLAMAGPDAGAFKLRESTESREAHGTTPSKITATRTEAAMKLVVLEKDKGPVKGVVIVLTSPSGAQYSTEETDATGYAEVLVPVGQKYEITYLSLGRKDVAASVTVDDKPSQNIRLTLRFKRLPPPPPFVLSGITFDTGKTTIRPESTGRLDMVVDFMSRKKSAKVEISGHTDNVGKPKANKELSGKRANACKAYLVAKGIDSSRIIAMGYGDTKPVAPNDSAENREKNRRIEVVELDVASGQ